MAASTKHTAFLRYSHDGAGLCEYWKTAIANAYPSNSATSHQSLLGVTSALSPLANDFRLHFFLSDDQLPPEQQDCHGCLGIGAL
jgi:hypothetical protein